MAMVAAAASAQYTCDPSVETVLEKGKISNVGVLTLNETIQGEFTQQGATVYAYGPDDDTRNLWWWAGWANGDSSYPGVNDNFDGYVALVVTGDAGWSGGGYNIAAPGVNTTWWNENTRFHLAYMTNGNAPASLGLILGDGEKECGSVPAKFAIGAAFDDNGTVFPAIAPAPKDDWQGIDISFADIKKLWPAFDFKAISAWQGNILSILSGNVAGTTFSLDAVYFYQVATDGVADVMNDAAEWVITDNTINVVGANGIQLFDLSGKLVKATAGSTLGISNVNAGLYIAKAGNSVRKVVVK